MKYLKSLSGITFLGIILWFCLPLKPTVEIIYPKGSHTLLIQSMYGDGLTEPSLEMLDDWKYGKNYLHPGDSEKRKFPIQGSPNDELSVSWSLMDGVYNLDEVIKNGEPMKNSLTIKRSDLDFCRLEIVIDENAKIISQKKYKGFCFK